MNTTQLQQWLAEGKTDRVLAKLLDAKQSIDPDLFHETTLLSARYENLARQKRVGGISFQEEARERAQINDALFEILKALDKQPRRRFFDRPWAKWGSILLATVTLLGGLAEASGYSLRDLFSDKKKQPATNAQVEVPRDTVAPNSKNEPTKKAEDDIKSSPTAAPAPPSYPGRTAAADTTLKIDCKTNKGRVNVYFKNGETMRFFFKVTQPCTVRAIYKLADGRLVLLDNDRPVSAAQVGQWLEVGTGFEASEPFGDERMYVFAQTAPFPALSTQQDADGYLFIKEGLPEALQKTRGFKKKQRFAEADVMLRTQY